MSRTAESTVEAMGAVRSGRRSPVVDGLVKLVTKKPLGLVGGIIVLVMFGTGIFAPVLAPYDYGEIHLGDRLGAPSSQYLLGTDALGRDTLSRVIYGARISMLIGLGATSLSVVVSSAIGGVSGFLGGKFDLTVQRFVDAWMCFPWLIIMITIMSIVGTGVGQLILVLGVSGGIGGSRVVRSAVIGIKQNVYVEASQAVGCTTTRILTRHILPNIMAPIIILFSVGMGGVILAEASLSFLGYGVPPPHPSWGAMLSTEGRAYMLHAPWLAFWPGLALSVAVFGINVFGDALRDLLDPRLRGGIGRYTRGKTRKRVGRKSRDN